MIEALLDRLPAGQVTAQRSFDARPATFAPLPEALDPALSGALQEQGISQLFSHQAEAVSAALAGRDVLVTTPTASGKTLCYNLPVLQALRADPEARALYLFPTKALAHDQSVALQRLIAAAGGEIGVNPYDGDTPRGARRTIRRSARVVLTNPDMLHGGILPHHSRWSAFLKSLRFVVIDELHVYRGVFGSHLANVLRRLERLLAFYGTRVQYLASSATLANPQALGSQLTGRQMQLVSDSGASTGARHYVFMHAGPQGSYLETARELASRCIHAGHQTILFGPTRQAVELLTRYLRDEFGDRVAGYRGGYLPQERREIEQRLREGQLRGVISTTALELGIDIGQLDVAILAGYPGSIASTLQQAGRAGRAGEAALTVLVGRNNPLDQYILGHPDYFFDRSPEHALINPDNLRVLVGHLRCAAFELPIGRDEQIGGESTREICDYLVESGALHLAGDRYHWRRDVYPASEVSLRRLPGDDFLVRSDDGQRRLLGRVARDDAARTIHPGAIYLVQGQPFRIVALDWPGRLASAVPDDDGYFTEAVTTQQVQVRATHEASAVGAVHWELGEVDVTERTSGFRKTRFHSLEFLGHSAIDLPESVLSGWACWCRFEPGALGGVAHLLHHLAALTLMTDVRDLGCVVSAGTITLYDRCPGGVGLAQQLYLEREALLERAWQALQSCACDSGCPSCVGAGESKATTAALLKRAIG